MLQAVVPPWYASKGPDQLIKMLRESRESIKKDIHERMDWENMSANIGWENIFVSSVQSDVNKDCEGKNIAEIAEMRGLDDPADAALNLLIEERLSVGMITFSMSEEDVIRIMKHPAVNFITDSLPGGGKSHPRAYGTFPRILGRYSRDQGVLTLEEAVRKMTSLPAEKLRLKGKGVIAEGYDSDIVIFNADKIVDHATFGNPNQPPSGIEWVIVNGEVVVENGEHTNARPGRTVRTR